MKTKKFPDAFKDVIFPFCVCMCVCEYVCACVCVRVCVGGIAIEVIKD